MSLHSFSHVCESIYHFFYQSLQAAVCVISVQLVWIRIMLVFVFFSVAGAAREKNKRDERILEERRRKEGKKRILMLVDCGAVTFSPNCKLKNIQ